MYNIISDIIGYTGNMQNIDSYILYTCVILICVFTVSVLRLAFKCLHYIIKF